MIIRSAELSDLEDCLNLDHSYLTSHVWQMDVQENQARVSVSFRTVRLPRPAHVEYPRDRDALLAEWHRRDCFLVATQEQNQNTASSLILGYLTLGEQSWHKTGWVSNLVVDPEHRREGIATQLLQAAKDWARAAGMRRLTVETHTKNYPAISLLEKCGFAFCGYNDRYYASEDIVLFFSLRLQ
jgi:ribosomal protein S18 acetylase RimI-like enzyme